jgi:hypothetical protein
MNTGATAGTNFKPIVPLKIGERILALDVD